MSEGRNSTPAPAHANASTDAPVARTNGARRLSVELDRLIKALKERPVRLHEVLEVSRGRGYTMLLILLTLPFCTPLPLPGFSVPFGMVVAFVGFRLALGQRPWLPDRLLNTRLPPKFLPRVLAAARRLARGLEWFLKPRLAHVLRWRVVRHVMGVMICICGLLMTLPFPIPFSNGLPALAVLLLAAAMLEGDGYAAVGGGVVFVLTLAFFAAILWGGAEVTGFLKDLCGGFFKPDDLATPP